MTTPQPSLTFAEQRTLRKLREDMQIIPATKTDEPGYCGLIERGLADFSTYPGARYCLVWLTEAGANGAP